MSVVVLDAEAVNAVIAGRRGEQVVRTWLEAARRTGRDVVVPAAVLAELYRNARHEAGVDSLLAREPAFSIAATDRGLARIDHQPISQNRQARFFIDLGAAFFIRFRLALAGQFRQVKPIRFRPVLKIAHIGRLEAFGA